MDLFVVLSANLNFLSLSVVVAAGLSEESNLFLPKAAFRSAVSQPVTHQAGPFICLPVSVHICLPPEFPSENRRSFGSFHKVGPKNTLVFGIPFPLPADLPTSTSAFGHTPLTPQRELTLWKPSSGAGGRQRRFSCSYRFFSAIRRFTAFDSIQSIHP